MNSQDNEITKEQFNQLLKELESSKFSYSLEKRGGKKVMVMRPPDNPESQKILANIEERKNSQQEWLGREFPFQFMTDVNGNTFRKEDFENKIVVVNYWFVECPPCIKEIPELNALVEEFKENDDIFFIAPSLSDKSKILSMLQKRPFNYALIPDMEIHAKEEMGISFYPTNMVIDKTGKVVFLKTGYDSETVEKVRSEIVSLLDG